MVPGFHLLFGRPGGGKTTEALKTFQRALYLATGSTLAQFYKQWLLTPEGKASGLALPKVEFQLESYSTRWLDASGKPMLDPSGKSYDKKVTLDQKNQPIPVWQTSELEQLITMLTTRASQAQIKNEPPPYNALIIDEAGETWTRVLNEIIPTALSNAGKLDTRKAYGNLNNWTDLMVNRLRLLVTLGMHVVLIAHEQEPETAEEKLGQPKFPSQGIGKKFAAIADSVLFRYIEDEKLTAEAAAALLGDAPAAPVVAAPAEKKLPMKRLWRVHGSQHWLCKCRGIPDEDFELIQDWPLNRIYQRAGFVD